MYALIERRAWSGTELTCMCHNAPSHEGFWSNVHASSSWLQMFSSLRGRANLWDLKKASLHHYSGSLPAGGGVGTPCEVGVGSSQCCWLIQHPHCNSSKMASPVSTSSMAVWGRWRYVGYDWRSGEITHLGEKFQIVFQMLGGFLRWTMFFGLGMFWGWTKIPPHVWKFGSFGIMSTTWMSQEVSKWLVSGL